MKARLLYNSLSGTLLYIINIIIMFIMSPVIIHSLGNRDYGLWEMVMSVVGYMGLLDLGIGPALLRYVAVAHSKDDMDELQKIISTAQSFFVSVGVVAALIMLVIAYNPALIAGAAATDSGYLSTVFMLFALNAFMSFPLGVFTAVLMGVQRHYFINLTRGVLGVIRAVIAYMLLSLYHGKGLLILALLEPVFNAIQFFFFVTATRRDVTIPAARLSACSWVKLKELFSYGSKSATLMIASRIQNASLPFVINATLGVSMIVYFSMPNRLVDYAKGLSLAMGFPLTPYFASQMTCDDNAKVKDSWLQTTFALQIITLAMPFFILFCGETFLGIWIGKEYAVAGRGVLYCLTAALFVEAIAPNANRLLMASGRHGRAAMVWLVLSIVSVPLAIFGAYQWGVTGVAFGSALSLIIGTVITLRMACCNVGVTLIAYLKATAFRLLIPLTLLGFTLWSSGNVLMSSGYLHLLVQSMIGAIVYMGAVWFWAISMDNKLIIIRKVDELLHRQRVVKNS